MMIIQAHNLKHTILFLSIPWSCIFFSNICLNTLVYKIRKNFDKVQCQYFMYFGGLNLKIILNIWLSFWNMNFGTFFRFRVTLILENLNTKTKKNNLHITQKSKNCEVMWNYLKSRKCRENLTITFAIIINFFLPIPEADLLHNETFNQCEL